MLLHAAPLEPGDVTDVPRRSDDNFDRFSAVKTAGGEAKSVTF
jgi:hypothetical protein